MDGPESSRVTEALRRGDIDRDTFAGAALRGWDMLTGPLAVVARDGVVHEVSVVRHSVETDRGLLNVTVQLVRRVDGAIANVIEHDLYEGVLLPEDLDAPAPEEALVREVRAVWAGAWRARLEHVLEAAPAEHDPYPGDLQPDFWWLDLLRTWSAEGPPGPRPHRLRLDPADIERAAREVRRVAPTAAAEVDRAVVAAYEVRGWRVLLAPHVRRPGSFEEDRVWVQRVADGAAAIVLMSDPWNPPVQMTIDGDAVVLRDAATWLREVVLRADLDVAWVDPPDPDDEDGEPFEWTVSEWLRFRDGWRDRTGVPLIDWRVQPDAVAREVRFWQAGIFGFDEPTRARVAEAVALWHAFLREVVDPAFTPAG